MDWGVLTSFVNSSLVDPSQIHQEHRKRNIRSKYDYLSVRVKIEQYEYVFSRFSLSRYLMACMVPPSKAMDISRRIKEEYVDAGRFEITQEELTSRVFELISDFDSSALTQRRFRLIQSFNLERIPLIIFISGTGFLGKSNLAFQLGERLNVSTILQTDIVCALTSNSGDHLGRALWYTKHNNSEEFFEEYRKSCQIAKNGIEGDIYKTLTDGKPLIVEGIHLDPEYFLQLCGKNAVNPLPGFRSELLTTGVKDRHGFILPLLVTNKAVNIGTSIRSSILGSKGKCKLGLDVSAITKYAVELQDHLISKFPEEFIIDISGADAINHIHSLFLKTLQDYYAGQGK